jgi:hypothetical protein
VGDFGTAWPVNERGRPPIVVVAATNYEDQIEPAILSRLGTPARFNPLEHGTRVALWKSFVVQSEKVVSFGETVWSAIANVKHKDFGEVGNGKLEFASGRDIENTCVAVVSEAEFKRKDVNFSTLDAEDFEAAFAAIERPVDLQSLDATSPAQGREQRQRTERLRKRREELETLQKAIDAELVGDEGKLNAEFAPEEVERLATALSRTSIPLNSVASVRTPPRTMPGDAVDGSPNGPPSSSTIAAYPKDIPLMLKAIAYDDFGVTSDRSPSIASLPMTRLREYATERGLQPPTAAAQYKKGNKHREGDPLPQGYSIIMVSPAQAPASNWGEPTPI